MDKKNKVKLPNEQEKFKSFIFLLIGQLVSLFGSSIVMFAIIWWISSETGSLIILSIAYFLSFAPVMILIPFTGVYADRWNKKKIIIISDLLQAILTLGLIILFVFGTISLIPIFILIALRGICQAFHQPALLSIIPFMVPQRHLSRLNSISFLCMGLLNVLAPLIAVFLLKFITIGQILWVDIITFSIAVIPSIFLKFSVKKRKRKKKKKSSFKKEFKEGILALKEIEGFISLLVIFAILTFLLVPFYVLMPHFVEFTHAGDEDDYALVMAFFNVGLVVGSIVVILKKNWNRNVLSIVQLTYFELMGAFFIIISPKGVFWFMGVGPLIIGLVMAITNTLMLTLIQKVIAPRKQGRALSIVILISNSVAPLSMILSGFFAEILGIYLFFWLCLILSFGIITLSIKSN